ncbi:hypothetical protein [Halosimplex salinum]|uniref:hypothetical protein n=1 Tax=Halosimplex salinum TaxID=1710538 RepID=UPI000F48E49F|nr:hypothetical protein [Halosimplex salinum]
MASRQQPSFGKMCRHFPIRTALFTLGPLVIGAAQFLNAAVHGSNLWLVAAVAAMMVAYSVLVTRYQLATFRRQTVSGSL